MSARTGTNSTATPGAASLLNTTGREAQPFHARVLVSYGVVIGLHIAGLLLLATVMLPAQQHWAILPLALLAYSRGIVHSFDFDHISMIDNSIRKFVAEGRRPVSVGLAFSAGHSTVVIVTGIALVSGIDVVRHALDAHSLTAQVLGIIGLSVSGIYLFLVAISNLASFLTVWRLRLKLRKDPGLDIPPDALTPRGISARIMTAPLRHVRHPRHVYGLGFLFALGFDTSSQIGLLMLTGAVSLAGAPSLAALALPMLYAAAMTLGDTTNGLMMLKMYESAAQDPRLKINFNLLITGISILSAFLVGILSAATLLKEVLGGDGPVFTTITALDSEYAGYVLAGGLAIIGATAAMLWRRGRGGRVRVVSGSAAE